MKIKNTLAELFNSTLGKLNKTKLIVVDRSVIKINTKSELNVKQIKKDFPQGVLRNIL